MNAELAQAAALAAHAKIALASPDPDGFLTRENSTFRFVHELVFESARRRFLRSPEIRPIGAAPIDWFRHLAGAGILRVDVVVWDATGRLTSHVAAGFAGGGSWGIRTAGAGATSLWLGRWSPDHRGDPEDRIWSVAYREFPGRSPAPPRASIAEAAERLRAALARAERLASDADVSPWAAWFGDALRKLDASPVTFEYHPEILPATGYGLPARRLLAACERAWAFGGMGSWNDLGFADPDLEARYRAVTPELYAAVVNGVAVAVNSYEPSEYRAIEP